MVLVRTRALIGDGEHFAFRWDRRCACPVDLCDFNFRRCGGGLDGGRRQWGSLPCTHAPLRSISSCAPGAVPLPSPKVLRLGREAKYRALRMSGFLFLLVLVHFAEMASPQACLIRVLAHSVFSALKFSKIVRVSVLTSASQYYMLRGMAKMNA